MVDESMSFIDSLKLLSHLSSLESIQFKNTGIKLQAKPLTWPNLAYLLVTLFVAYAKLEASGS